MQFEYNIYSNPDEGFWMLFAGIYAIALIIGVVFGIAFYIMRSIGIQTIAKRRGLNKPWLVWLPVGFEWTLGSISDQYRYVVKGEVRNKRKVLLGLSAVNLICSILLIVFSAVMGVQMAMNGDHMSDSQMASAIMVPVLTIVAVSCIVSVLAIVMLVFRYMSMYDLYRSCDPNNAVAYLVLGILFNILEPIFLLIIRKKDGGMPPRKDTFIPAPVQPED